MQKGVTPASVPPAIITSAAPRRMTAAASPMPWLPDAQAVTTHELGPRSPSCIETCPADMLTIVIGIISGEARSGPRSSSSVWLVSKVSLDPLPVEMTAPARSPSPSMVRFASSRAICAATTANWLARSMRRTERRSRWSAGSKSLTSQAIRHACWEASKRVIVRAVETPASAALQALRQPMPRGETIPSPVITTRRAFGVISAVLRPRRAPYR